MIQNTTREELHYFVGCCRGAWEVFKAHTTPTEATHGHIYNAVIGPFKTQRGAIFMAEHGRGNPHCQTVADAERIALDSAQS